MKIQPRLFQANPQAMAATKARRTYEGHPDLGAAVDRDTWLTPRYILDQLGSFDLDPCAADPAPLWVAPNAWTASCSNSGTDAKAISPSLWYSSTI